MKLGIKKIKAQAKKALKFTREEPRHDIMRENVELEQPKDKGFRFSSFLGDIKKNWVDGRH
ncbi:MAG TPA: hypothetical protein VEC17_03600 [Candidatus Binatia bacterium]|nr:hypothetical protein [Candidatus Binatia bacterium]